MLEEHPKQTMLTRYTHTSQLVKARAVSALGGGFGGGSAPSSLTSQPGLQQVRKLVQFISVTLGKSL